MRKIWTLGVMMSALLASSTIDATAQGLGPPPHVVVRAPKIVAPKIVVPNQPSAWGTETNLAQQRDRLDGAKGEVAGSSKVYGSSSTK